MGNFCKLLGPSKYSNKDEVWIDTVIIPKQICSGSSVEDNGIEDKDTFTFLRETSLTKNKVIVAWVHTRSSSQNSCEFSFNDMHTQFVLEKYVSKDIIGIIIQLRKVDYIWNAMRLNIFGRQRVEYCGKNFNTPYSPHKWCDCECLYDSIRSNVKLWEDIPFGQKKVILGNFMEEKEPGKSQWGLAIKM